MMHQLKRTFVELVVEYRDPELCAYKEYKGKPYYSIKYIENGETYVGYGTYNPKVLSRYLSEYFISSTQQWHVIEKDPMTEDERKEWSERLGYDIEYEEAYFYSNLPDDGQDVLVSTQYGVYEDTFHQDEGCYFEANGDMDGILAWMPLPEPYKERE